MTKKTEPEGGKRLGQKVLLELTEEQWFDLLDRLTLFTQKRYFGIDARDSIQEAILAVIAGRRGWDINKTPFHNLCLIIRSVTSNQLAKNKKFISLDNEPNTSSTETTAPVLQTPSYAEAFEQQESDEKFRVRISKTLRDDEISRRVVDHVVGEKAGWQTRKIAEALGEDKKEINNARRRLMRKLRVLMQAPGRT